MDLAPEPDYDEDVIPADLLDGVPSLSEFSREDRPWRIEDEGGAEWAMRVYAKAANNAARFRSLAVAWTRKIEAWLDHQLEEPTATMQRMEALLKDYALRRRLADPKAKATLTLPSGAVTSSHYQPTVKVADPAAFVAWARSSGHLELLRLPPPPDPVPAVAEIKKAAEIWWQSLRRCSRCGTYVSPDAQVDGSCDDGSAHSWEEWRRPSIAIGDEIPDGLIVEDDHYTFTVKPS